MSARISSWNRVMGEERHCWLVEGGRGDSDSDYFWQSNFIFNIMDVITVLNAWTCHLSLFLICMCCLSAWCSLLCFRVQVSCTLYDYMYTCKFNINKELLAKTGGKSLLRFVTSHSLLVRAPDSWADGWEFESWQEQPENFLLKLDFVCCLLFDVRFTPTLPQWHVKDPDPSAQSAGGRLHLNTYTLTPMKSEWTDYAAVKA